MGKFLIDRDFAVSSEWGFGFKIIHFGRFTQLVGGSSACCKCQRLPVNQPVFFYNTKTTHFHHSINQKIIFLSIHKYFWLSAVVSVPAIIAEASKIDIRMGVICDSFNDTEAKLWIFQSFANGLTNKPSTTEREKKILSLFNFHKFHKHSHKSHSMPNEIRRKTFEASRVVPDVTTINYITLMQVSQVKALESERKFRNWKKNFCATEELGLVWWNFLNGKFYLSLTFNVVREDSKGG